MKVEDGESTVRSSRLASTEPFAVSAAVLTLTSVLATLSGLAREASIAARYGTSAYADAGSLLFYFVDTSMVIGGMCIGGLVFAPYLRRTSELTPARSWAAISNFTLCLLAITAAIFGVAALFATDAVRILFPGFNSLQQSVTVDMIRMAAPPLLLTVLGSLISGTLQAFNYLSAANIGRILLNGGIILGITAFSSFFGYRAYLAGFYVGAVGFLALQLYYLKLTRFNCGGEFRVADPEFPRLLRLAWSASFSFILLSIVLGLIERSILSGMPAGTIAANGFSNRVMMAAGTISIALQTVALKAMSDEAGQAKKPSALENSLKLGFFVLLPLSLFLWGYASSFVTVLFDRGMFDTEAVAMTASATRWYALAVIPGYVVGVTVRAAFAFVLPRVSLWIVLTMTIGATILDLLLREPLGPNAIPVGYLGGGILAGAIGLKLSVKNGWLANLRSLGKNALIDVLVGGTILISLRAVWPLEFSRLDTAQTVIGAGLLGVTGMTYFAVYLLVAYGLGRPPAREIVQLAMSRFPSRRK